MGQISFFEMKSQLESFELVNESKCGECCIKEGMDKVDRLEMFKSLYKIVEKEKIFCSSCGGLFVYKVNGSLGVRRF